MTEKEMVRRAVREYVAAYLLSGDLDDSYSAWDELAAADPELARVIGDLSQDEATMALLNRACERGRRLLEALREALAGVISEVLAEVVARG